MKFTIQNSNTDIWFKSHRILEWKIQPNENTWYHLVQPLAAGDSPWRILTSNDSKLLNFTSESQILDNCKTHLGDGIYGLIHTKFRKDTPEIIDMGGCNLARPNFIYTHSDGLKVLKYVDNSSGVKTKIINNVYVVDVTESPNVSGVYLGVVVLDVAAANTSEERWSTLFCFKIAASYSPDDILIFPESGPNIIQASKKIPQTQSAFDLAAWSDTDKDLIKQTMVD